MLLEVGGSSSRSESEEVIGGPKRTNISSLLSDDLPGWRMTRLLGDLLFGVGNTYTVPVSSSSESEGAGETNLGFFQTGIGGKLLRGDGGRRGPRGEGLLEELSDELTDERSEELLLEREMTSKREMRLYCRRRRGKVRIGERGRSSRMV